jgi:DNA topoisomerase-1
VWISPDERGHIQAVGRDQRGRKQYRYHPKWRQVRDETKYEKMIAFVHALPQLRAPRAQRPGAARPAAREGAGRRRAPAGDHAHPRRQRRVRRQQQVLRAHDPPGPPRQISGSQIRFRFKGKSGVEHDIDLDDPHLAKIVRKCQELPGAELLQYVDDAGAVRDIGSGDVNDYLREITGQEFTAKDFRTWAGTVLAARALQEFELADSQARMKKNVVQAIESVAKKLGNTRAVCKKCYIHPAVLDSYMDGSMLRTLGERAKKLDKHLSRLRPEEAAVLVLLQRRLAGEAKQQQQAPPVRKAGPKRAA